jgi:hypothetical protein
MRTSSRAFVLAPLLALAGCAGAELASDPPTKTIEVGDARIDIVREPGSLDLPDDLVVAWVRRAALTLQGYYGKFPVSHATVTIEPISGHGVQNGVARGEGGASVHVEVGEKTTLAELDEDWVMTHEMIHLGFPDVGRHWLEEGIAVYVEPLARARAGLRSPEQVFQEMLETYAQGLPQAGDLGLDHMDSWARTYYGGAIFCLVADIQIREKTSNYRSLVDALKAIQAEGGDITKPWTIERALETGDKGTGVSVLVPLYRKLKDSPGDVDLDGIWKALGVERQGKRIVFHDDAPLADIRRAMTSAR